MKTRKIWSIPIAAMVMAMMFAALWLTDAPSSLQAQVTATPTPISASAVIDKDHPTSGDTALIAAVKVPSFESLIATTAPTRPDLIHGQSAVKVGTNTSDDRFEVVLVQEEDANQTQRQTGVININRTSSGSLVDGDLTLEITFNVDRDTTIDSDDADNDDDNTTGNSNDADDKYKITLSLTVLDVTTPTFHLERGQIFQDAFVSTFRKDLDTEKQTVTVENFDKNSMKILSSRICSTNDCSTEVDNSNYVFGDVGGDNMDSLPVKVGSQIPSANATLYYEIVVDSNTAKDGDDANDTATDNDKDITLQGTFVVTLLDTTPVTVVETDADPSPNVTKMLAGDFTIKHNVTAGHAFGRVTAWNVLTDTNISPAGLETLDAVITDSDRFKARKTGDRSGATVPDPDGDGPRTGQTNVNVTDFNLIYTGKEPIKVGEVYEMTITVNGDTGFANRTKNSTVRVTISAANVAPTATSPQNKTIKENDAANNVSLSEDTKILSIVASDEGGDTLTYSVPTADVDFKISNDNELTAERDIPAVIKTTTRVGTEDVTTYAAPTGWMFAGTSPASSETKTPNLDIYRKVTVTVSDGVTSNDQEVSVTVTIDLNQDPVYTSAVTETTDATTGVKSYSYSGTATVDDDERGVSILDISTLITDADSDTMLYTIDPVTPATGSATPLPAELDVDSATGNVVLLYVPTGMESKTYDFVLKASDQYNPAPGTAGVIDDAAKDAEITVSIAVTIERPVRAYPTLRIDVPENTTGDIMGADGTSVRSVSEVLAGASYDVIGGSGGHADFAVDSTTGAISVLNARDYDADGAVLNPSLTVNVRNEDDDDLGNVTVILSITDVDEDPTIAAIGGTAWVYENAQINDPVVTQPTGQTAPSSADAATVIMATDPEGGAITFSIKEAKQKFAIGASSGALTVSSLLDYEKTTSHTFTVVATDAGGNTDELSVTVMVLNSNEAPTFTAPTGAAAVKTIPESHPATMKIFTFTATDADLDDLTFTLRQGQSQDLFEIKNVVKNAAGNFSGDLHARAGKLDFEDAGYDPRVHVEANDPSGQNDTLLLTVNLSNVNDNDPVIGNDDDTQPIKENSPRETSLGDYSATDRDNDNQPDFDTISYILMGNDAKHFDITAEGELVTHASLDYDSSTPCNPCDVTVVAFDSRLTAEDIDLTKKTQDGRDTREVRITVGQAEDSVSTVHVTKANPVPGTGMGDVMSALAGTKATMARVSDGKVAAMERPADLPNTDGKDGKATAPVNFVETEWANWGTVLRIEVTAESPDPKCDGGNRCVVVRVASDSGDHKLDLKAYRMDTPEGKASNENKFVAAVKFVETEGEADSVIPGNGVTVPAVYKSEDGASVAALYVDEEDEVEIEFGNLRSSIDVENEAPEISNFTPAHETAFDDADVDYTFSVTDDNSGLPEAEDLPDGNGNKDYNPVVALISKDQCASYGPDDTPAKGMSMAAMVESDKTLYCPGMQSSGEFVASNGDDWGFAPIRDDKDFDETDNGVDVETTVVLTQNAAYYVTFIACDNAGNCTFYDPDGNKDDKELAQVTVDTKKPAFVEARTGLTWDTSDNKYDDDRTFIQVIFNELTQINPATVEIDDFVVEGHSIKEVHIFENPDDDDVTWADSKLYGKTGNMNLRGKDRYRDIENTVFLELEDELLADETPQVTIVPNGVEDAAGNEQDGDGEGADGKDAKDWISPKFTIVSIVSPRETSQSQVLAGEDDEVVVTVTSDERLDSTRPTVMVTYVNAPDGSVDTKGTASCKNADDSDGTRKRGEIVIDKDGPCQDNAAATGSPLTPTIEKISNTEWVVTISEPKETGYYNFYITGKDRSKQNNEGSEGVDPDKIVVDFFDADGDVDGDAVFFEGDRNLPKPRVHVSGHRVTDNEADVEFRSPLFVELDFTEHHSDHCGDDDKKANCMAETKEYAKDNFDSVTITMFELDGVDMTDMVKTTDDETFLVSLESIALGDHTAKVQAVDQAGNTLEDTLEIDFEVNDRDPFSNRLNPGWNLVSLPGAPADSSIATVLDSSVEVRTVYTYDPVVPGGWQVAVRETLDSDWQGDLTEITGQRGYWVLSDAIQDWEVNIPRMAGGAAGTGTPIQPPSIALYAGWNLIPVTDVTGDGEEGDGITVKVYLNDLDDGLDLVRVLGFNTIKNEWMTLGSDEEVKFGEGYWVFVREAGMLVPGQ